MGLTPLIGAIPSEGLGRWKADDVHLHPTVLATQTPLELPPVVCQKREYSALIGTKVLDPLLRNVGHDNQYDWGRLRVGVSRAHGGSMFYRRRARVKCG